jgi:hypothetical protein
LIIFRLALRAFLIALSDNLGPFPILSPPIGVSVVA